MKCFDELFNPRSIYMEEKAKEGENAEQGVQLGPHLGLHSGNLLLLSYAKVC